MPIDNKKVQNQPLPQILPKHPHRVLYILLFTLIFVLVAGGIVMFQINKVNNVMDSPPVSSTINKDLIVLKLIDSRSQSITSEQGLEILRAIKEKSIINNK